jgi:hypothetical protein
MTCIIKTANDKGNLSRKDTLVSSIHYTINELKNRGYKKCDYKNCLINSIKEQLNQD